MSSLLFRLKRKPRPGLVPTPAITVGVATSGATTLASLCAPFGIVFSGATTTHSDTNIKPIHDLVYFWDFGDIGCSNYTNGELAGKTRNLFVGGPFAAHVYETPGSYTCQMWAWDGVTMAGPVTQSVQVNNPDDVFPGAATTVVSTTGNFAGAPTGANQVTVDNSVSDFSTVCNNAAYLSSNKRVLFRIGETFNVSAGVSKSATQNIYVGAFGGAGKANLEVKLASIPVLAAVANAGNPANNPNSWRITRLACANVGNYASTTFFNNGILTDATGDANIKNYTKGNMTLHDCTLNNNSIGISMRALGCVVSKVAVTNINNNVASNNKPSLNFLNSLWGAALDSNFDNGHGGEHCALIQGCDNFAFTSNTLARPASTKQYLNYCGWTGLAAYANGVDAYNACVSYNRFDASTRTIATSVYSQIGPFSVTVNEPIRDLIWEGNYYHDTAGVTMLKINGRLITARNNIFNRTASPGGTAQTIVLAPATPTYMTTTTTNLNILNNTCYNAAIDNLGFMTVTAGGVYNVTEWGNLVYSPNTTTTTYYYSGTNTNLTTSSASFNSNDSQCKSTNPLFVGTLTSTAGFALQSGSPYKNITPSNKALIDALQVTRNASRDAGAVIAQ